MDTIPDEDFIAIFHRLAQHVRLGRVRNPDDIKKRIKRILDLQRMAYQNAQRGSTIRKYRGQYKKLRVLYRKNIHERIWDEAVKRPGELIDQTLDYGYANAKRLAMERARERAGRLRRLKRR